MEYEASFKLDKRSKVKELCKLLMHTVDGLVQYIARMVPNVVNHFVCEMVITNFSEVDTGHIQSQVLLMNK